jgi:urease accessory protein
MKPVTLLVALGLGLAPTFAQAHIGYHPDGFAAGFSHPFTGLDHLLAMVAVGLWAASLGGAARFVVPGAFLALMAVGGAIGLYGAPLPMVESAIAASVVILGLLVALEVKLATPLAAVLVGAFALFHGHAHGTELPAMAHAGSYVAGFLGATAVLHMAGLGLGLLRFGRYGVTLSRLAGAAMSLTGIALLAS